MEKDDSSAVPLQPYGEWHDELKHIAAAVRKKTRRGGKVHSDSLDEQRHKLSLLHTHTREHAADVSSATARVGEAMLLQHEAALEKLAKRHLHEAHCYEAAASLWLGIEAERFAINEASLGEALYYGLICTAMSCSALVADAAQGGDITLSQEAALHDALELDKMARDLHRSAPSDASVPTTSFDDTPAPSETVPAKDGEADERRSSGKAMGVFFKGLRTRIAEKAALMKATIDDHRGRGQTASSGTNSTADSGSVGSSDTASVVSALRDSSMSPSGRPWLPRNAEPHNFRHAGRVHSLLSRLAERLTQYGCCELAADLFELAAQFLLDEKPGFASAQLDEISSAQLRAQLAQQRAAQHGSSPVTEVTLSLPSVATSGATSSGPRLGPTELYSLSAAGLGRGSLSLGGNCSLIADAGYLPPCRVPLKHLSAFLASSRRVVCLLLSLQQYDRASVFAHESLAVIVPFLNHHRTALLRQPPRSPPEPTSVARQWKLPSHIQEGIAAVNNVSSRLWFKGSLESPAKAERPAQYDEVTGRRLPDYALVKPGGVPLSGGAPLFGSAECAEVMIIALSRVLAALLSQQPPEVATALLGAFAELPTNLQPSPDASSNSLTLKPRAKAVHAVLSTVVLAAAQYTAFDAHDGVGGKSDSLASSDHGVTLPPGPQTFAAAVRNAADALIRLCACPLLDPSLTLAIQRLPDAMTWDSLHRYLSSSPLPQTGTPSPSPKRVAEKLGGVNGSRRSESFVDPNDLSP